MSKLENWSIVYNKEPYQPPELKFARLKGKICGDNRFVDGDEILTGHIIKFDSVQLVAKTKRTNYQLGKIDDGFQKYLEENNYTLKDYDI